MNKALEEPKKKMSRQESGRLGGLTNSLYKPEYDERAIELMREGAAKVEVAAEFGVAEETIYDWVKTHSSFAKAIKKGESLAQRWFIQKGKANMDKRFFQTGLWTMFMKNMFGWTDRVSNEISGPGGQNIQIQVVAGMLQPTRGRKNKNIKEAEIVAETEPIIKELASEPEKKGEVEAKT